MANWCNARLIVVGRRSAVLQFSRQARARPSSIFEPDMLEGESQDLFSEPIERCGKQLSRKKYIFQGRNDDGRDHFRKISQQFQSLYFVLVYGDPNSNEFGSYFIRQGRSRSYLLPERSWVAVKTKLGVDDDSDDDSSYWDANWEAMDLAEAHWEGSMDHLRRKIR